MPKKVSGRRLYATLDRLDSANVLIQLEYDAFANRIIIHLTPNSTRRPAPTRRGRSTNGVRLPHPIRHRGRFFRVLRLPVEPDGAVLNVPTGRAER